MNSQKLVTLVSLAIGLVVLPILLTVFIEWDTVSNFSKLSQEYYSQSFARFYFRHPAFRVSITFILSCIVVFKLGSYVVNFNRKTAFLDIVVPLALLLILFNWKELLIIRCFP